MIRACWFTLLCSAFSLQISAQKNIDISIQFGGEQLSCRLYIAATYDSAKHPPLVISLHGFGGDGPEQERYDKLYQVADTAGFLLAYPSGHNNAWNAGADYYAPFTTFDDVGFINALIDSINAIYPIDLSRVYACGMSNGGDMVYRLACELSNRIAAIGSVTGTMITDIYSSCAPQNKMPVIHFHGNADKISNISGGDGWVSLSKTMKLWRGINECVGYTKELLPDTDTKDKSRAWLLASDNCANELNY